MRRRLEQVYLAILLLALYLPTLVVIAYSFNESKTGVLFTGFTTRWYAELFKTRAITDSFRVSLAVALASCALSAAVGTLGAVGLSRTRLKAAGVIENVNMLPVMLPEIVLGMADMALFSALDLPFGYLTLILAHTAFCVPYVLIQVRTRLVGLDPSLVEAARDLGASPLRAFCTVTLPLIAPAIFSGVLLAFAMSLDDMVISFFVCGPETTTFPVYVYGKLKTNVPPSINAMCTLTLLVSFAAVFLSRRLTRRGKNTDSEVSSK